MGTKHNQKAKKGTVSLQILSDRRRFKYRYDKKIYYIKLPATGIIPLDFEELIRKTIELDVLYGKHDCSQNKYKNMLVRHKENMFITSTPSVPQMTPTRKFLHEALKTFLELAGRDINKNLYYHTYAMTKKWNIKKYEDVPLLLSRMNYAPNTFNSRKMVLNLLFNWLVKQKQLDFNPLDNTPSRKKNKGFKPPERRGLSDGEITLILDAIRTDKFVKKYSHRFKHHHYYSIFEFLIYTGVRPAEAIGLQVGKVDLKRNVIIIDQALARTRKGTSSKNRIMKSTKTDNLRELPFQRDSSLGNMLFKECQGKIKTDLVFTSPNGLCFNDRVLNESVLAPVLKGLGISHRILYVFRHSFATRCFERGMDIKSVQALTGHRDASVLLNIYAEVTTGKVQLPSLKHES